MSERAHEDISASIISFLESLPTTIRVDVLVFVLVYGLGDGFGHEFIKRDTDTFLPSIVDRITSESDPALKMGLALRTIAALDFVLYRAVRKVRSAKSALERMGGILPEDTRQFLLAGVPLRTKHEEQALANWKTLRATVITPDTLVDYEDILLRGLPPSRSNIDPNPS